MSESTHPQLIPLGEMDGYRVCATDSDPRGWRVVDANAVEVARVEDLIIDVEALTARYILCSLSRGPARTVLVPTGFARIEKVRCVVHLDFVTAADLDALPTFRGLPVSAELVAQTEEALTGVTTTAPPTQIVRRSDTTRNAS